MRRHVLSAALSIVLAWTAVSAQSLTLPNKSDSVKFAVIGDMGTGDQRQYAIANELATIRDRFGFDTVIMLGDNLYGGQEPKDFVQKFERPYKPLLDAGVKFYAALGNHDSQNNRFYKPWNMNGERYYTYSKKNVRFFVLDSDYMDPKQLQWLESELQKSREDWKVAYFHHPLYSSGGTHGSEYDLRKLLEPLFTKYRMNVVFSGHDHIYERIKPQNGVYYFVAGAGGALRKGDLTRTELTVKGYDQDCTFMLAEVDGNAMYFDALNRTGEIVDSGAIERQTRTATQ
jgi:predicted phosphodiesterase